MKKSTTMFSYSMMILDASRYHAAPRLATAYSVSEFETPVPRVQPEVFEDSLDIQELFMAPSLPRGRDHHRDDGRNYENHRSVALAPPTLDVYPDESIREDERPPIPLHDVYDYDRHQQRDWYQQRAASPQSSCSSSCSSELDCGECAYTESKRRYDNHYHETRNPVPYDIIPGDNVGQKASPSSVRTNTAHYIHEAPRVYRPHDFHGPSPPEEGFWNDRTTGLRNQIVLYRGTAQSSNSEGWLALDKMHSNGSSSPGWSTRGQRHLSGSEAQSDMRSESPFSSSDGVYEDSYLRFARQTRRPQRRPFSHQRPVIITRSNDEDDSEEYSSSSRSNGSYSSSERSLNSEGYHRRGYTRRD